MSAPTLAPAPPDTWWRRHRSMVLIGCALAVAMGVVIVLGGGGTQRAGTLDPDNPTNNGAQALARVLGDHGVDVTVVRSADELETADPGPGTTVLVTSTDLLGRSTTERLLEDASTARIVVAGAGPGLVDALGSSALPDQVRVGSRAAGCDDPLFADLTIEVGHALAYPGGDGCFVGPEGSLVVERSGVTLFGADEALRNDRVLRADNAAVVVRLLGQDSRLVWYLPSIDDLRGDDGVSLSTLLPRWLKPGLWLGAIVVVALILWRGRRLGPLAAEPLPVVVKAIETTRSRGRLYRKAGDRGHAAAALRDAARTRAAERLRLGVTDSEALVRDLARHLGRPEAEIAALLGPHAPAPATDKDLIVLASELAALDREVRRT
ncbi:MAG: secreted protein [Nocardioides sp.]|nr:secreted protein [Nocardioides sp.]